MQRYVFSIAASAAIFVAACADPVTDPSAIHSSIAAAERAPDANHRAIGGVYVATNNAQANAVVAFARFDDGTVAKVGEFGTGGAGIGGGGDPLQSQGSVVISTDHKRLYVVNAGSNSISAFSVSEDASLRLLGTVGSGGAVPISLAVTSHRLYVLNADNSVSGFAIDGGDAPQAISQATLSLGPATDGPSTINASRNGDALLVTERAAGALVVIAVHDDDQLTLASRRASSGNGPFGFAVTNRNQLIVSEAAGAAPNGAVSSYALADDGSLSAISTSLSTHQAATCWLVLTNDGRFAYAANAASGSISGYAVSPSGSLSPLNADGRSGVTNDAAATPLDMSITRDGKFLYVLQTGTGTVGAFAIGHHGQLTVLPDVPGLAAVAGFQGIATF